MDRDTATIKLENRKVGTYLLRVRPQVTSHPNETMYALSLKWVNITVLFYGKEWYNNNKNARTLIWFCFYRTDERIIKHMKINKKEENDNTLYYLSTRRHFKTIVELVSFYERNDLGENFAG